MPERHPAMPLDLKELEPLKPSSDEWEAPRPASSSHSSYVLTPTYDLGQPTIFDVPSLEDGYEPTLLNQPRSDPPFHALEGYNSSVTSGIGFQSSPLASNDPFAPVKAVEEDEGEFCINYKPSEPGHPHAWSVGEKWWILFVICTGSVCVTATSRIQASTYTSLEREFGVSRITAVAGVSLYVLGFGVGALFLGPMSEFFGRRVIYLVSFTLFTIFGIPVATAQNMGIFLFFRFITGLCGSGFLSVAGGSVSDLFQPGTTDIPVAVYTLSPLIGPCVGPLLGGFINQHVTWRVTFYTVIGWSSLELVLLYFFVPETFLPVLLKNEAVDHRVRTGNGKWYAPMERNGKKLGDVFPKALYAPIQLMMTEKMALALDLWTSLVLGIIYLFFNAIPYTFRTVYDFNLQSTGLAFIPMGIGMILATLSQVFWVKQIRNQAALNGGKAPPEARLPVGMAGAILVPAGLLWFSLSSFSKMPWIMPLLGTVVFGCGAVYVFSSVFGFLVSTFPKYAASAMAGNTLLRCVWAAAFPLFADAMYRKLGPEGATGLLPGLAALMAAIPFVLYKIGSRLREVSTYSS